MSTKKSDDDNDGEVAMDIDTEMAMSDDGNLDIKNAAAECAIVDSNSEKGAQENVEEITTYAEAAKTWLFGLKWKPYPPLLTEQKIFGEEHDSEDIDPSQGLMHFYSDYATDTSGNNDAGLPIVPASFQPPSPILQQNFDHREFIFTMLQKLASTQKTRIGPLTLQAVTSLSNFSASLIDDALSGDDERIHQALKKLFGDLHSGDTIVGELIDERKWDVAEDIAADCVNAISTRVAQEVDFYRPASGAGRADPVFSLILAETDWLLYEMVCFISDEDADMSLYEEHFYGPSEEEKQKRKALELQMNQEEERKRQQQAPIAPVVPEMYAAYMPPVLPPEHHFGYNYIAPQLESSVIDPATASYWQTYYDCQQQAAFVQAAAYSYNAKQRAQYMVAQVQAANTSTYQQPYQQLQQQSSLQNPTVQTQSKSKSLAVKFVQAALKTKSAESSGVSTSSAQQLKREEKDKRDKRDEPDRHKSSRKRSADDERLEGPFYCMVTNLLSNTRASEVERAVSDIGRIESVKVLRDKAAQPPENALASITFRYVYKAAFDKLLSTGLKFNEKYRPIARLQSDPFASSTN